MAQVATCIESLENYLERSGACLTRTALPDCVHGRLTRDRITLRAGLSPEQELVALVHELTHWLVHRNAQCEVNSAYTLFEYEAEAVESLVMVRLGLQGASRERVPFGSGCPTDNLLSASVARVKLATVSIYEALGLLSDPSTSETQAAVDVQTASREEIILEYEPYGMGDFFGLPKAL